MNVVISPILSPAFNPQTLNFYISAIKIARFKHRFWINGEIGASGAKFEKPHKRKKEKNIG